MKSSILLLALAFAFPSTATLAQHQAYAGMQARPIKALSGDQVADLKNGRGMGLALAAELNGYPGPSHLLELGDKLSLSPDQRAKVQRLFDSMKAEALPIGARLIEQESELDRLFVSRSITPEHLKAATTAIAITQGELRETHLKYHLATASLLSQDQIRRYGELRGYGGSHQGGVHHH
jgi:hypothetical protein